MPEFTPEIILVLDSEVIRHCVTLDFKYNTSFVGLAPRRIIVNLIMHFWGPVTLIYRQSKIRNCAMMQVSTVLGEVVSE